MEDIKETIALEDFLENPEEVLKTLGDRIGPLVLTVNGKRMAVMEEYEEFERQQSQVLVAILKMRYQDSLKSKSRPAEEVFGELKAEFEARVRAK